MICMSNNIKTENNTKAIGDSMEKKYKIGYTQGTFDMFHVGHLNLIKHAKERCEYLIVGVNTDRLIAEYKNKNAVVPLEERVQIIEAIRYVDQVIVTDTLDKVEVLKNHKYDAVFIGDDWKGNQRWADTEVALKEYDVDVVYLPHTEGTTSTLLRDKIKEL